MNRILIAIIAIAGLIIYGFFLLNRTSGRGAYLLFSEGYTPDSNVALIVNTVRHRVSEFCSEALSSQLRCSFISSSLDPNKMSAVVDPPSAGSWISVLRLNLKHPVPKILNCEDCTPIDISASEDGSRLIAAMFSELKRSSGIWVYDFVTEKWFPICEVVAKPGWVTRPLFASQDQVFFLSISYDNGNLASKIYKAALQDGKCTRVGINRSIVAYVTGPNNQLAVWSEYGLEIISEDGHTRKILDSSALNADDSMRPNALVWDRINHLIAVSVTGRKSGLTRIIEIDIEESKTKVVFSRKLGRRSSLQLISP